MSAPFEATAGGRPWGESRQDAETAPGSIDALPRDARLPGLAVWLDPERLAAILSTLVEPGFAIASTPRPYYLRYKPGTACIVGLSVQLQSDVDGRAAERLLYAKILSPASFGAAAWKIGSRGGFETPGLVPITFHPAASTVLRAFPNDRALPGARWLGDPIRLRRSIGRMHPDYPRSEWRLAAHNLRSTVVRWKPERRAVLRVDLRAHHCTLGAKARPTVWLRAVADRSGATAAQVGAALRACIDPLDLCVARPLAWEPEARLLLVEHLDGVPAMARDFERPEVAGSVARGLAALHRLPLEAVCGLATRDSRAAVSAVRSTARLLARVTPEWQAWLEKLVQATERLAPAPPEVVCLVHGDLHPEQILRGSTGTSWLDFDRAHRGDATADLGSLLGPLSETAAAMLLAAYEEARGTRVDAARLRFWRVVGLWRAAVLPLRGLEPRWRSSCAASLEHLEEVIA